MAVLSISAFSLRFHRPTTHYFTKSPVSRSRKFLQLSRNPICEATDDKFDWYSEWYPVAPICDVDKRRPHGKKIIGIDVVIWWDRNDNEWKVFEDSCPHRLAPLSEGRIDEWGRLQCVYHGWCFGGSGDCKFIPQAPRDGPPVHTSKRACVAVYPCCVQNGMLWFWPNTDPQYQDIYSTKKPPYIPEIDDPSFINSILCRDIPYGYEVLIENLMDPAHLPYAHYGIMRMPKPPDSLKADREGGVPLEINVQKLDIHGFTAKAIFEGNTFIPPCLFYRSFSQEVQAKNDESSALHIDELCLPIQSHHKSLLVFYCIPVSPGNSRLIMATSRNFGTWIGRWIPPWITHMSQNLIIDSDLYLLHVEERKLMDVGPLNWHKSCYVPTKSDAIAISFRRWLNKYGGGGVDWGTKYSGLLPPTPPREQLFDRYWSHTVKCSSCSVAHRRLNVLRMLLQIVSIGCIGLVAAVKQGTNRIAVVSMSVVCFVGSKWLSHFIQKTFCYHDYDHAFR